MIAERSSELLSPWATGHGMQLFRLAPPACNWVRSEEHTSELQSPLPTRRSSDLLSHPNPASTPNVNGNCPSFYMGESVTSPKYLYQLVGTFADDSGAIVGTPFAVGNGPWNATVPFGATRLQLGEIGRAHV